MPETRNRKKCGGDRLSSTESQRMCRMRYSNPDSGYWLESTRQQSMIGGSSHQPKAGILEKWAYFGTKFSSQYWMPNMHQAEIILKYNVLIPPVLYISPKQ